MTKQIGKVNGRQIDLDVRRQAAPQTCAKGFSNLTVTCIEKVSNSVVIKSKYLTVIFIHDRREKVRDYRMEDASSFGSIVTRNYVHEINKYVPELSSVSDVFPTRGGGRGSALLRYLVVSSAAFHKYFHRRDISRALSFAFADTFDSIGGKNQAGLCQVPSENFHSRTQERRIVRGRRYAGCG